MARIRFFSKFDLSIGVFMPVIKNRIIEYSKGEQPKDINDYIEIHNIKQFYDNRVLNWTEEEMEIHYSTVNSMYIMMSRFFNYLVEDDFINTFNSVDKCYIKDFWMLIEKFKVYERISDSIFCQVIDSSDFWLSSILCNRNISYRYGKIIRDYMLRNSATAKLILDEFEIRHRVEHKPFFSLKNLIIMIKKK
jgi:hypothetical protein